MAVPYAVDPPPCIDGSGSIVAFVGEPKASPTLRFANIFPMSSMAFLDNEGVPFSGVPGSLPTGVTVGEGSSGSGYSVKLLAALFTAMLPTSRELSLVLEPRLTVGSS
jgi:hypothetical protein